ncbi:MAG TPA: helix-turn-helix domain-containing protein, partial [Candidatus Binataceae bacterium]|nr:helix-turn-helix domain-containing protein [Candidatus Binataceae bacterium]
AQASERQHKKLAGFDEAAMAVLTQYDWPGNVRELQNEIERAVALARQGDVIAPRHLSASLIAAICPEPDSDRDSEIASISDSASAVQAKWNAERAGLPTDSSLREARAAFEARYIADVLERCSGNVSRAAKLMRMSRVQLQRKVKDYGLR